MKNSFVYVLILACLLCCVACNSDTVSPTEIQKDDPNNNSSIETTIDESSPDSSKADAVIRSEVESVEPNQPEEESISDDKSALSSQQSETQGLNNVGDGDEVALPTSSFTSIDQLETWLKTGKPNNIREEGAIAVSADGDNYYLRPTIKNWTLRRINTDYGLQYYYAENSSSEGNYDLKISIDYDRSKESSIEFTKQKIQEKNEDYFLRTVNGIDYWCFQSPRYHYTIFAWEQYGFVHSATVYDRNDQFDEILPLLQVEKVSYKVNDHVTQ